MKKALPFLLIVACASGSSHDRDIQNMEPEFGYDVGDLNLRADLPFNPQEMPDHLFVSPTVGSPYWWVLIGLPDWNGGPGANVSRVTVNGRQHRDFYILVNGEVRPTPWITKKATSATKLGVVLKMMWSKLTAYEIAVEVTHPGGDPQIIHETRVTAPGLGGGPEGFLASDVFKLTETAGLDREAEPMEIVVAAYREEVVKDLSEEIRLYRYDLEEEICHPVPFQVFEKMEYAGMPPVPEGMEPKGRGRWAVPSESVRVAFLAEVPANSTAIYLAAYGGTPTLDPPEMEAGLSITDAEDGSTVVSNAFWKVDLHPKCGQLNSFDLEGKTPAFVNSSSGTVHWNPDAYGGTNRAWGHAFSWDPPENTHVAARGPILYRVTRSGRMPGYNPEVQLSVTYSFWAGVPYVRMSSTMVVTDDFGALAIRNGEMVFDAELFDAFAWKEKSGQIRKIRALHRPDPLIDAPATPAGDIPWVALYHTAGKYALGGITLTAHASNPRTGSPSLYRPCYFLYDHPMWSRPLNYFVRTWVYPFGHNDRGPVVPIAAGSTYIEEMAFLPFRLEKERPFRPLQIVDRKLRTPLEIEYGH